MLSSHRTVLGPPGRSFSAVVPDSRNLFIMPMMQWKVYISKRRDMVALKENIIK